MLNSVKLFLVGTTAALLIGCGGEEETAATGGIAPQQMADALHLVMESDRTVYTRQVVNRLAVEDRA